MIDQTIKVTLLFDVYGDLLTERQRKCIELHYFDDLSLAEVAEHYEVSRQAVHDLLKRSVQTMEVFEEKLGLVAAREKQQQTVAELEAILTQLTCEYGENDLLSEVRKKIRSLK